MWYVHKGASVPNPRECAYSLVVKPSKGSTCTPPSLLDQSKGRFIKKKWGRGRGSTERILSNTIWTHWAIAPAPLQFFSLSALWTIHWIPTLLKVDQLFYHAFKVPIRTHGPWPTSLENKLRSNVFPNYVLLKNAYMSTLSREAGGLNADPCLFLSYSKFNLLVSCPAPQQITSYDHCVVWIKMAPLGS